MFCFHKEQDDQEEKDQLGVETEQLLHVLREAVLQLLTGINLEGWVFSTPQTTARTHTYRPKCNTEGNLNLRLLAYG